GDRRDLRCGGPQRRDVSPQQTCGGTALAPTRAGWVADGGPRRELFSGRAADLLFPRLLPLMDGTRSMREMAATLGIAPAHVHRVAALLRQRNLLRLLRAPADSGPVYTDPMSTFLRRCVPE